MFMRNPGLSLAYLKSHRVNPMGFNVFYAAMSAESEKTSEAFAVYEQSDLANWFIWLGHLRMVYCIGIGILCPPTASPIGFAKGVNIQVIITWRSFMPVVLPTAFTAKTGIFEKSPQPRARL
jgi:hypothetical protein